MTHIESSGNNELNNPATIASASTINQVLAFPPTAQPSPSPTVQPTQRTNAGGGGSGGSSGGGSGAGIGGGGGGSITHLVTGGQPPSGGRVGGWVDIRVNPYHCFDPTLFFH